MNSFTSSVMSSMSESAVRRLALWAGLQIASDMLPSSYAVTALELCTLHLDSKLSVHLEAAKLLAQDDSVPSGIRSAVLAQIYGNYMFHTEHAIEELAKIMGWGFIENTISDLLELGLSQIA